MKRLFASLFIMSSLVVGAAGCGDDDKDPPPTNPDPNPTNPETVEVSQDITADTTWKAGNTYVLKKYVFVNSGTLNIEAGATVKGENGSALIITRNARINAVGTADKPIVFTSSQPVGQREAGNWGGVVLLGKARLNVSGGETTVEGFFATSGNEQTKYGGQDDAHNCGTLKYARIEFAGFELAPNNELNGLTVGGCGSATDIDYVQVHLGLDDGIEMFGGTAPLKHIVITQADDDALDYDLGYTGKVQFLVVQQSPRVGDRAIEASSHKTTPTQEPISAPEIWNASFIGSNADPGGNPSQEGLVFNTGAGIRLRNAVVAYFKDQAVDVDGEASAALFNEAGDSRLSIRNTFFFDNANLTDTIPFAPNPKVEGGVTVDPDVSRFNEAEKILVAANGVKVQDPQLTDATNLTAPNFLPKAGSPLLNPDNAATPGAGFDTSARFVGAFGTTNWMAGWTAFPQN
ncbi:hypothetical protein SAMN05443572_101140 [Myxococcus fulvus]|uniref:Lipoprotein n=1 Tax=Myxococcus fulvus TaxID=33 RepID=A0A511T112_MYXFU|nr:hypothetical protein [Myxococcus fulvus]GEN07834.1 hypothetical protein MFU01_28710 [Myxococcus fulvus]SES78351.1 hypothetical protein SAMN05443572_101140 [Myxococcus fulvus]